MLDSLVHDVRYAFRTLAARPGFTLAVVLTLALGIGANATLYSLINAILFKPVPGVHQPDELVAVFTSDFSGPAYGSSSYADLQDFRALPAFTDAFALTPRVAVVGEVESQIRVGVDVVTPNYFNVLGTSASLGRVFTAADAGGVVISRSLWQRLGAPPLNNYVLRVNGTQIPVLGVAPDGFGGIMRGRAVDLWVPIEIGAQVGLANSEATPQRGDRGYLVYARLKANQTVDDANNAGRVLATRLEKEFPDTWRDLSGGARSITVIPERAARVPPRVRGPVFGMTGVLFATVGIVLLVCCSNVAGLMLARVSGRARELAIRASLGATGGRIVRQVFTEAILLSLLGGAVGLIAALWMSDWIAALPVPSPIPLSFDVSPDARVLGFALLVTTASAVLFGLAPALRMRRPDLTSVLKGTFVSFGFGRARRISLRELLVVGQLSLSLLLLIGSMLFFRNVRAATTLTPGFPVENLTLIDMEPRPGAQDGGLSPNAALVIRDQIAALPGVQAASWANNVPLEYSLNRRGLRVQGYTSAPGEEMEFGFNIVGPDYFSTIRIPVLRGRDFSASDRVGAPAVTVVNETFAKRFFGERNPLGQRLSFSGPEGPWVDIVGVVRTVNYVSLGEEPRPYFYLPAMQENWGTTLHVRTATSPEALLPAVNAIVKQHAPTWTPRGPRTYASHLNQSLLPQRIASNVFGLFGVLALLLASVGLYATVALWVTQRTRDFGVRLALGAAPRDLLRVVFGRGGRMVAIGVALGVVVALVLTRFLTFLLVGVGGVDTLAFVAAPSAVVLVAIAALVIPALRIMRLDPLDALRAEQ